ncbi:MAG: hypothetical protein HYY41_03060 [Chloroflexi bacterium]|nr:hypothetical protein [Chloroflexota bacterium]
MELLESIFLFIRGTFKRAQWYLPPLLLDPFDIAEKVFQMKYVIPQWIAWLLFGLGWFLAMALTYHELRVERVKLEKQLNDKAKKKAARETLAIYLNEGQVLKRQCANEKEAPPGDEAYEWAHKVEHWLEKEFDKSYVTRFRNTADVPMAMNSIFSTPHRDLWGSIHTRLYQLGEFLKEIRD